MPASCRVAKKGVPMLMLYLALRFGIRCSKFPISASRTAIRSSERSDAISSAGRSLNGRSRGMDWRSGGAGRRRDSLGGRQCCNFENEAALESPRVRSRTPHVGLIRWKPPPHLIECPELDGGDVAVPFVAPATLKGEQSRRGNRLKFQTALEPEFSFESSRASS